MVLQVLQVLLLLLLLLLLLPGPLLRLLPHIGARDEYGPMQSA